MTSSPPHGSRLDALRRTTGDQSMVGGVAGGLAKALGIDPVIVRIAFVVLVFAGFSGVVLYAAFWLLVPAEGHDRSALGEAFDLRSDSQLRTAGLVLAGAFALVVLLGDSAWGPGPSFWGPLWVVFWAVAAIAGLYWLLAVRPRTTTRPVPGMPPPPYVPPQEHTTAFAATQATGEPAAAADETVPLEDEPTMTIDEPVVAGDAPPVRPGSPSVALGQVPPRPPRDRWSPTLLLVTLSAILVAMGALALWSLLQAPVAVAVYPAVALGVVAAGLLVGTKVGHPGALIPLGLLILPVLAVASVVPNISVGSVDLQPRTAAEVAAPIEQGFGRVIVDLTAIEEPQTLLGRTLEIDHGLGQTTVVVPDGLDVEVDARLSGGGRIEVLGTVRDGNRPRIHHAPDAPGAYRILITGTAGEIQVIRS